MSRKLAVFGAVGGFFSLFLPLVRGETFDVAWYLFLLVPAFGAFVGYVGVHVFPTCDTSNEKRCLGFALTCGLFWNVALDGLQTYMNIAAEKQLAGKVETRSEEVESASDGLFEAATPDALGDRLREASSAAATLLDLASGARDAATQARAKEAVARCIEGARSALATSPGDAASALTDLATAAARHGAPELARKAWDATDALALQNLPPAVAADALEAAAGRESAVLHAVERSGGEALATRMRVTRAAARVATDERLRASTDRTDVKRAESFPVDAAKRDLKILRLPDATKLSSLRAGDASRGLRFRERPDVR